MLKRILKKDMKRKKSVNFILFLFLFLASVFLSSSINNILVVSSAVGYYMDYANVPDVNLILNDTGEKEQIDTWLKEEAPNIMDYGYSTLLILGNQDITLQKEGKPAEDFDVGGSSMYLGTTDSRYCKVFDSDGNAVTLKKGEIAIPMYLFDKNNLKVGDHIHVKAGNIEKEFTVATAMKDAAYGSEMVGMARLVISNEDYLEFSEDENADFIGLYYVDTPEAETFNQKLDEKDFSSVMNTVTRSTYELVFSFDMIIAALLILIGICLILIALLVLRFTLIFTMEEEYREIGIMKAVGIPNFSIQKLYLVKYLVLVVSGSAFGMAASVPIGRFMIAGVSKNLIMEDSSANLWVNVLCTMLIIVLVMLFCYGCTRKLGKISAIAAINGGNTGKRYKRRSGMRLSHRSRMPVPVFLGINDMLSNVRRYVILIITFCVSFILITIPLNTLNTMQSKEMAVKFAMNPESAVYVKGIEGAGESTYQNVTEIKRGMARIEGELKQIGYEAELTAIPIFFFRYEESGKSSKKNIMTVQIVGPDKDYLTYQEGTAPELPNEIAFSIQIMKESGWKIGDTVKAWIGGKNQSFVITGTYSDYMQIGKSARMNPKIDLQEENVYDCWNVLVDLKTELSQKELAAELQRKLPDYEWSDAQTVVDRNVGGIQESLQSMLFPMTGMLCGVIMLITFLMERLFIVREKGEIAMMKSVGYKNRVIRRWQIFRMICVAGFSMVAAIPLSFLSNQWILKPIFAIMGADLTIQVVPWQVYGLYPGILLAGIILATGAATWNIKNIHMRELNNLE